MVLLSFHWEKGNKLIGDTENVTRFISTVDKITRNCKRITKEGSNEDSHM